MILITWVFSTAITNNNSPTFTLHPASLIMAPFGNNNPPSTFNKIFLEKIIIDTKTCHTILHIKPLLKI